MALSILLIGTLVVILLIWLYVEVKRARHKVFAIVIILLIVFFYFSVTNVFHGKTIDYKSVKGVTEASQLYFSWLGGFYGNLKTITMNTINMDWSGNNTSVKTGK
jgi:glucan phosphoethanolaminetransferase (alkaline phosphatase superfamily)